MDTIRLRRHGWVLAVFAAAILSGAPHAQDIPSPEEFLGHQVGADYKLVPWDRIVEYFRLMGDRSDRMNVRDLGTTTEGKPFIFVEISSAETIADLAPHKANQQKIADPRLITDEADERRLVLESKVPVLVNCQLHSNETAGSQMSMELAYDLVTGDSDQIEEILDGTIVLVIPCANPDGQVMVAEWYERSLGEPWEGTGMPWLYQKYAGHDNNRDWFMLNLKETRLTTEVLYNEWFPTIVWDVHQMGNSNARLFVPPFHDPKNANVHPIIDQTLLIIGGHMAGDLARAGKQGVVHGAIYDNWWAGGFRTTPYRHNMVGILTEAASVNLASPVFQRKSQLRGSRRGLPKYEMSTNFPDPWPGGWWRLRDIVEYEKVIAMSLFTLASRYHDRFQENYIHFGREALETGANEPPFAWLVPPDQRDPGSAYQMLERLHATAIEVHEANAPFEADGVEYPAGTFIMYCAQPYRPHLMDMMERQVYPDREQYPGGPAESPYDMAGWTMPLQMGVRHVGVQRPFDADATKLDAIPLPEGSVEDTEADYLFVLAGKNDDFRLMTRMHAENIAFKLNTQNVSRWLGPQGKRVPLGSIVIPNRDGVVETLRTINEGLSTDIFGTESVSKLPEGVLQDAVQPRTALYQPWTASMDEGWTRLALDNFEVPYTSIHNAEIRAGNLRDRYDCIVLPSISARSILNGRSPDTTAPEYVGGIGEQGVVGLQDFVQAGGTLVCIDQSTNLVVDHFNAPVHNLVADKPTEEFYCPGSVLRLWIDVGHPLGYGMPEWYSGYFARSQAFGLGEAPANGEGDKQEAEDGRASIDRFGARVVSRFSDTVLLESGWIRGDDLIRDKPAIVEIKYGGGNIDLIGIGVQRRGQPHGTFRILFNAIQRSTLP
jgi:hypothetical protein